MPRWRMRMWIVLFVVLLTWWGHDLREMNGLTILPVTLRRVLLLSWGFLVGLLGGVLWVWEDKRFMRAQQVARLLKANGNSASSW